MQQIVFIFLALSLSLRAQDDLRTVVSTFADDPRLGSAVLSIDVREVGSGLRIASYDPELACIPASTQKLLTTAAALDLLGPDYRFTTRLKAGGTIENGVLRGNLFLVGGGDPTLGSPFMDGVSRMNTVIDRWAQKVADAGIRRIEGAVVGDGSYYGSDGAGYAWPYNDLGNYYGAGAYGLNVNENSYYLFFTQRQREGSIPPVHHLEPPVPGLRLINELRSGPRGSGDQAYIFGAPYNYENYVRGSIPVGTGRFRIRGSIPDPPLFAAQQLHAALERRGISVAQATTTDRVIGAGLHLGANVLDELQSPPLAQIIDRTNLRSNNLYAENLLREVNKARGRELHELSSTEEVVTWLEGLGLNTDGMQLQDGSGLANRNFFSARLMTDFLLTQARNRRWRQSIPLAGKTGSLRGALRGTAGEGRVRAKSGSLDAARAYAGYIERADGRQLAFSIMVNNYTMKGSELNRMMLDLMLAMCTAGF